MAGANCSQRAASRVVVVPRLLPLLATILAFCLVAAAATPRSGNRSAALQAPHPPPIAIDAAIALGLVVLLAAYALLVIVFWSSRRRDGEDDDGFVGEPLQTAWWERPLALLAVTVPLVALAVLAYLTRSHSKRPTPVPATGAAQGLGSLRRAHSHPGSIGADPRWIALFVVLMVTALATAGVVVLVRSRRRRGVSAADRVHASHDEARAEPIDPRAEPDPRRSVQAAYATMEQRLAGAGLERREAEAPREYLARLHALSGPGLVAAEKLTGLFERARWSAAEITPEDRGLALDALTAVDSTDPGELR